MLGQHVNKAYLGANFAKSAQIIIALASSGGRREDLHITIPLEPRTKKNHQQIIQCKGRPLVIPSKEYKKYEKDCRKYIDACWDKLPFTTYDCPVNVKCEYYMATWRRVDLVNLQEATLDILVKYGVLLDDNCNIVASMDGSRVLYDKENPRTEIEIEVL